MPSVLRAASYAEVFYSRQLGSGRATRRINDRGESALYREVAREPYRFNLLLCVGENHLESNFNNWTPVSFEPWSSMGRGGREDSRGLRRWVGKDCARAHGLLEAQARDGIYVEGKRGPGSVNAPNVDVHGILFAIVLIVFVIHPLAQWALGR